MIMSQKDDIRWLFLVFTLLVLCFLLCPMRYLWGSINRGLALPKW